MQPRNVVQSIRHKAFSSESIARLQAQACSQAIFQVRLDGSSSCAHTIPQQCKRHGQGARGLGHVPPRAQRRGSKCYASASATGSALASSPAGRSRMPQALLSLLSAVSATLVEPMVTLPYQAWHCSAEFSHKCGAVAATYCARLAWMAGMPGTTCPDDMSFGRIGCISSRRRRHPFPGRPRRPCYERLNNRKLPEQKQLQHLLAHNCWRIKQQLHLIAKQCGTSFYRRFMSKSKAALTAVSADYSLPAVSATGKTLRAMDR